MFHSSDVVHVYHASPPAFQHAAGNGLGDEARI